ncbi:MAG: LysR family transcriptional regulator [Rhizobiales bacterium]|nr:LysR family transcriptional regulator [Hyphomicrobiales bacterium]
MRHFDPDLLQTLVTFADAGSLVRTAAIVGRTPSAVTAQMQRLEDAAGTPLLEAQGRGRILTEAGLLLVGHARRILAAHNDAWLSVTGVAADGRIGLGVTQDFADSDLPVLLNRFVRFHPRIRIELRVGRSSELAVQLKEGQIDLKVAMRGADVGDERAVFSEPMCWLWAAEGLVVSTEELPLALLDAPCGFRNAALDSLERVGRPYRIAATSTSLSGVRAAVRGGIAVTARTARWQSQDIVEIPSQLRLPTLPKAEFAITTRSGSEGVVLRLADVLAEGLGRPG